MMPGRGRIVRGGQAMSELTVACGPTMPSTLAAAEGMDRGRIVRRERVEVAREAAQVLALARQQASELEHEARARAEAILRGAEQEGLERGAAKLATAWMRVHQAEAKADQAALDRSITIGRLLAERLIGETLRIDPERVADLAREAMHHLWRSRRVAIHAHPDDVAALQRHVATFGMPPERIAVMADPSRQRGSLRFTSDFGELDGEIGPQLDRLAEAIRQELGAG